MAPAFLGNFNQCATEQIQKKLTNMVWELANNIEEARKGYVFMYMYEYISQQQACKNYDERLKKQF